MQGRHSAHQRRVGVDALRTLCSCVGRILFPCPLLQRAVESHIGTQPSVLEDDPFLYTTARRVPAFRVPGHRWTYVYFLLMAVSLKAYTHLNLDHHFSDILVGGLIGVFTAIVAFRQTFASVTDFRFNHILLPRAMSLLHRKEPYLPVIGRGPWFPYDAEPAFLPRDLPVAREGGWTYGAREQVGGAPGDATALAMNHISLGLGGGLGKGRRL